MTCLFLILKKNKSNNYKIGILFLIAAAALMFWHPEISIALILVLGADVVSQLLTKKRIDFLSAFLFFLLIFLSYLIYVDIQLFINIVDSIFIDSSVPAMLNEFVSGSVSLILILQYFWAFLSVSISTFFISYLGLNWLKNPNYKNIFMLLSLIFFYILPILSLFSSNFALNPERSFAYYSILSIFIISVGISKITESKIQTKGTVILIIFFFVFAFSSSSSYFTGDGNALFNDKIPKGTIFTTQSNFVSYNFLNETPKRVE